MADKKWVYARCWKCAYGLDAKEFEEANAREGPRLVCPSCKKEIDRSTGFHRYRRFSPERVACTQCGEADPQRESVKQVLVTEFWDDVSNEWVVQLEKEDPASLIRDADSENDGLYDEYTCNKCGAQGGIDDGLFEKCNDALAPVEREKIDNMIVSLEAMASKPYFTEKVVAELQTALVNAAKKRVEVAAKETEQARNRRATREFVDAVFGCPTFNGDPDPNA